MDLDQTARSDCSFRSSLIWVHTVCLYAICKFEKFARRCSRRHKQTTFSGAVFLGALRVNSLSNVLKGVTRGINTLLTLKMPRKPASENVICLYHLLHLLANFSNLLFAYRQTVWTQIRLLLEEQSDLGPHCLQQ